LEIFGSFDRAAPFYLESLAMFEELGDELAAADLRFRVAANLTNRGDVAEGARAMADALAEFRRLDHRIGEAQAVGYQGYIASRGSDLATAADRFETSLAIAREVDWPWWALHMLSNLAEVNRRLRRLDDADRDAREALGIADELGDRMSMVFSAAEVAWVAALRGDVTTAGRIWGAIEAEEEVAPIGQWPAQRAEYEAAVRGTGGPQFERGREQGRLLSLVESVDEDQIEP